MSGFSCWGFSEEVRRLSRLDVSSVEDQVSRVLCQFPEVAGAYLFGSALEGCRPESDIDLGLVLRPGGYSEDSIDLLAAKISLAIGRLEGRVPDIIVLNHMKPTFAYRVISRGRLIYAHDRESVTDFIERVSRSYGEVFPRYKRALDEVLEGYVGAD